MVCSEPRNLDDFAAVSHGNFVNWPAEFGKIFCGKLWALFIYSVKCLKFYKKFDLRLTRRAKAYSGSYSQTVSLSPAVFTKDWQTTVK